MHRSVIGWVICGGLTNLTMCLFLTFQLLNLIDTCHDHNLVLVNIFINVILFECF